MSEGENDRYNTELNGSQNTADLPDNKEITESEPINTVETTAESRDNIENSENTEAELIENSSDISENTDNAGNTENHDITENAETPVAAAEETASPAGEQDIPPQSPQYKPPHVRKPLTEEEEARINKYKKFKKVNGETYKRVNTFLRKHTYITAREWAIARLCADFTTRSGAEMTFIGENLPDLVPFMTDTYSPQAVNQARASFKKKVKKSGASFFYGALCGFFTADELDDILYESSEVARFLLEIEGTSVDVDDEIEVEDRITDVMRNVAEAASRIRAPKLLVDPQKNGDEDDFDDDDDFDDEGEDGEFSGSAMEDMSKIMNSIAPENKNEEK